MRVRSWLVLVVMMGVLFLVIGCTPLNDQAQIESVINGYANAMSNQNWNKARSYCLAGSSAYLGVGVFENLMNQLCQTHNPCSINYEISIASLSINHPYAEVGSYAVLTTTLDENSFEEGGYNTIDLQKVDEAWKIVQLN